MCIFHAIFNKTGGAGDCFARDVWYNTGMDELKETVSRNLTALRKRAGMTQLEVAEKINYTDKAVSKWERGEGLPDLTVLVSLSRLYGVPLDYFIGEHGGPPRRRRGISRRRAAVILCACALVWFAATLAFVLASIFGAEGKLWLAFIAAVPASCIILVVFSALWGSRYAVFASVSALLWSAALLLFLSVGAEGMWLVFVAAAPLQALAVFWFILRGGKSK